MTKILWPKYCDYNFFVCDGSDGSDSSYNSDKNVVTKNAWLKFCD